MSTEIKPSETRDSGQIGRLNAVRHPRGPFHRWTPASFLLAAIALAVMLVILIVVLTFVFSAGAV